MLEFHVAGSTGNFRAGSLASLLLASAMLISQAVFFVQRNLGNGFVSGYTPSYAQIMCMKTLVQIRAQKEKKEKEAPCLLPSSPVVAILGHPHLPSSRR